MASVNHSLPGTGAHNEHRADTFLLLLIAGAIALLHLATNNRYGFHRDELQFLTDACHMDWGFVAYPPLTPFVEHVSMGLFGLSLAGLRLASVVAQALALLTTGLIARELGGNRLAQIAATIAVALSPLPLFEGTEFQYTTFDFLWWVLIAYFVIRLLKSEDARWWMAIGTVIGLGLLTKYAILFYVAGILAAFLLTSARRLLLTRQFCLAVALALLIFLPNLIWQIHHHFISYAFLQSIHRRDVGEGRADGFLRDQFLICTNVFAAPLWIAGLIAFLRSNRYRALGWMYLVPFALFFFGKGRGYYVAGAYPMLMASGAVAGERWLPSLRKLWRRTILTIFFAGVAIGGMYACALILPLATGGRLMHFALANNDDLREEFGWRELVQSIAAVRDNLPADQRANTGVLTGNYGEQGAVEIYGPEYQLPAPIGGTNSAWLRGYPDPPPSTLIVVGLSPGYADRMFFDCRIAAHRDNPSGIQNEESRYHADILVCGPPRLGWTGFWKQFRRFG